jgi:malate dehydrogenase (quinone)
VLQSPKDRLAALREFVPTAKMDDWELAIAGQRVQIVKKDKKKIGMLQFGTEVIHAADGSIACLLGASPGASTAVSIMLELIGNCFPEQLNSTAWQARLKAMIPSHGESLITNEALHDRIVSWTRDALRLREAEAVLS